MRARQWLRHCAKSSVQGSHEWKSHLTGTCSSLHTTFTLLQATEWLQDGGKVVIPSINIPSKSQEITAPVTGRQVLQKLLTEENLVKKMKLHLFAGANRLGGYSLNLHLLSSFSMPVIQRMEDGEKQVYGHSLLPTASQKKSNLVLL